MSADDEPLYCTYCAVEMGDGHTDSCEQEHHGAERGYGPICEVDGYDHREAGEWCRFHDDGPVSGLREYRGGA